MRKLKNLLCVLGLLMSITACGPVKTVMNNQYQLDCYSDLCLAPLHAPKTILITHPESVSTYQSTHMFYVQQPHALSSFSQNAWISPPADMLFPLIIQSMQRSGYFRAVLNGASQEEADYRLDTQLINLEQNFLKCPSSLHLRAKVVLTDVHNAQIIASRIFYYKVRCPTDTPYGGVLAANIATKQFTCDVTDFVIAHMTRF